MSRSTVAILGWYGSPNVGDEAELAAILTQLATLPEPPATIVFSTNPAVTRRRFSGYPGGLTVLSRSPLSARTWRALARAKLLIYGGGGLIQDQTSIYNLLLFTTFAAIARTCGTAIMWWGVGAEPIVTGFGRLQARLITGWCKPGAISVRDEESLEILKAAGVAAEKLRVTTDPALVLPPASDEKTERLMDELTISNRQGDGPLVLICLRDLPDNPKGRGLAYLLPMALQRRLRVSGGLDERHPAKVAAFQQTVAEVANHLIGKHKARIVFLPFWAGRDDAEAGAVIAKMQQPSAVRSVEQYLEPRLARALIGRADLVVSVRLHPLIFAASAGVPAVGFTYARKIRGFLNLIGVPERALNTDDLSTEHLKEELDRLLTAGADDVTRLRVEELRALARGDLEVCAGILG